MVLDFVLLRVSVFFELAALASVDCWLSAAALSVHPLVVEMGL